MAYCNYILMVKQSYRICDSLFFGIQRESSNRSFIKMWDYKVDISLSMLVRSFPEMLFFSNDRKHRSVSIQNLFTSMIQFRIESLMNLDLGKAD